MEPHGTRLQLQLSRLLGGVEQSDRGDKVRRLHPTTGAMHGKAQRTVDAALGTRTQNDGPRPMEIGPQRASCSTNRLTVCQRLTKPMP